jgi:hypothetical protein
MKAKKQIKVTKYNKVWQLVYTCKLSDCVNIISGTFKNKKLC